MELMTMKNKISELERLYVALNNIASENSFSEDVINDLSVCLDEVFSNIVNHAYDDDREHDIEVRLDYNKQNKKLAIAFMDGGKAFNPLETEEPDLSLDILDREIGGLGVFIVSNIMSSIEYSRTDDKNKLEMTKDIE